jgi:hypothetical protein
MNIFNDKINIFNIMDIFMKKKILINDKSINLILYLSCF